MARSITLPALSTFGVTMYKFASSSSLYSPCNFCHITCPNNEHFSPSNPKWRTITTRVFKSNRIQAPIRRRRELVCRAEAEIDYNYKFPDPIPEFARAESEKFRTFMLKKLATRKELFGDSVEEVAKVCTQIFEKFLHTEYGGPGTLLVIPFMDMADALKEQRLPGGPQAARAAIKWAQNHVDKDWKEWTEDKEENHPHTDV